MNSKPKNWTKNRFSRQTDALL